MKSEIEISALTYHQGNIVNFYVWLDVVYVYDKAIHLFFILHIFLWKYYFTDLPFLFDVWSVTVLNGAHDLVNFLAKL